MIRQEKIDVGDILRRNLHCARQSIEWATRMKHGDADREWLRMVIVSLDGFISQCGRFTGRPALPRLRSLATMAADRNRDKSSTLRYLQNRGIYPLWTSGKIVFFSRAALMGRGNKLQPGPKRRSKGVQSSPGRKARGVARSRQEKGQGR